MKLHEINQPEQQNDFPAIGQSASELREKDQRIADIERSLDKISFPCVPYENTPDEKDTLDKECLVQCYFDELHNLSDYSSTIPSTPFTFSELMKISPETVSALREEFDDLKANLKREWETLTGHNWPKYDENIYSSNNKLIRKAGTDYDAHHIQPLSLGGKNEVVNITPLHASVHYDRQGIHSTYGSYDILCKALGSNDCENN